MWERTLQDLIRGLRSHRHSSKAEMDAFLDGALAEIREELRGKDMELKAEGLVKMCYLMMLFPVPPPPSFSFHVVEVMSSPRYHLKQLGYLAAPLAFAPTSIPSPTAGTSTPPTTSSSSTDDPILILTINNIRKDLLSPHAHLPPLALAGLGDIMTEGLAREVEGDLAGLLGHSKAYVRKRAVLALFKVFEKYPEALRTGFPRLRERLEDEDAGVVSATVNVITELSRKTNPKNYLPLAPQLFELLTTSSNNWMLIKIVKLFATLTPIEPRLVRKLLPPLTNLISTTPAISLLYECVRTCIVGGMLDGQTEAGDALARVCVEKLSAFLTDDDQNLKYIALLAMVKIVPSHPDLVADYQEDIMKSLDDEDVSIRMRALELVSSMANRRNAKEIVGQLLSHLVPSSSTTGAPPLPSAMSALARSSSGSSTPTPTKQASPALSSAYRLEVARRILSMTRSDTYANITDFEWYLSVLVDLVHVANVNVGPEIRDTVLDVVGRVKSVRPHAVVLMSRLLADVNYVERAKEEGSCSEVLYAAAWICGEYSQFVVHAAGVIADLLQPQILALDPESVAVSVFAATKVFGCWATKASEDWDEAKFEEAKSLVGVLMTGLERFERSSELEVQERASNSRQLFRFIQADLTSHKPPAAQDEAAPGQDDPQPTDDAERNPPYPKSLFLLQPLFTGYEMNPVGYKAQESVRIPDGLDLDAELVDSGLVQVDDDEFPDASDNEVDLGDGGGATMEELRRVLRATDGKGKKSKRVNEDGSVETKEQRAARKAAKKAKHLGDPYYLQDKENGEGGDADSAPPVKLQHDLPQESPAGLLSSSGQRSGKSRRRSPTPPPVEIDRSGEMPEGADPAAQAPPSSTRRGKGKGRSIGGEVLLHDDITQSGPTRPSARFEEYEVDDEQPEVPREVQQSDLPAAEGADVQVVQVKKKKKKKAGVPVS